MNVPPDRLRCVCSTIGFENEHCHNNYYPEVCPKDWRVAYFMNDFRAVYLRQTDWLENLALIGVIVEEIDAGFELVLECPADLTSTHVERLLARLAPLQQNIACLVLGADGVSLTGLRQALQQFRPYYPINLDLEASPDNDLVALATEFKTGFVWRPEQASKPRVISDYQVVRLPYRSLRDITPVLQVLKTGRMDHQRSGLFLEPAPKSPQRVLQVRTVIELMGLA